MKIFFLFFLVFVNLISSESSLGDPYNNRIIVEYESFLNGNIWKIKPSSCFDFQNALKELKFCSYDYGIILDLRHNCDEFFQQEGKNVNFGVESASYFFRPIVILISKFSTDATQSFAQALKDKGTAIIVGDEKNYYDESVGFKIINCQSEKTYQTVKFSPDIHVPIESYPSNLVESKDGINFLLKFPKRLTTHMQKILPILQKNSATRISQNKNFQLFITNLKSTSQFKQYGTEDLQMQEAINIIKDIIYLYQFNKC